MATSLAVAGVLSGLVVGRASYCGVYCGGGGREITENLMLVKMFHGVRRATFFATYILRIWISTRPVSVCRVSVSANHLQTNWTGLDGTARDWMGWSSS